MRDDQGVELQPDTAEVIQAEPDYELATIPVCISEVKAPVRVQQLPRKGGATFTRTVAPGERRRVLTADHYRAKATLMHFGVEPFYVAFSEASSEDAGSMAAWPANVPFTCEATTEVWVAADAAEAAPVTVAVVTELWAAGE